MGKENTLKFLAGLLTGAAASTVAIAAAKTFKEIKNDTTTLDFVSSDEKNTVKVAFGSSSFAKGLTMIKITAENDLGTDEGKFVFFAGSKNIFCEWKDDKHFELIVGKGKIKHFCEVSFESVEIVLTYAFKQEEKEKDYVKVEIIKGE